MEPKWESIMAWQTSILRNGTEGQNRLTNHWLPTLERLETPPSPLTTVLFPQDPDFVSHDTPLDQIGDKSLVPGSRIALVGLGEKEIITCHQILLPNPILNTGNMGVLGLCEQRDLIRAKFPIYSRPGQILGLESWLRDEKRGRWVLILDNVDDHEFLRKSQVIA
ncbi:hypothetical protein N7495_003806 [Penicillium taxi]|uniref:uncharacterized protein n=1 Tax=Penicillium taxi TaxID=168475 RepID=UPI00254530FC|nr:uncharacterized protein N7495_003806 [Penicillium taxi]KAJ5899062.1 hypothetical protein N7495_003806 [Penicillium taxi]